MMNKIKFMFYTMTHPGDGFYEIRHRGKGSVRLSLAIVFLFAVSFSINRQYASFIVNDINPMAINSILEVIAVFALFILFCGSNWSISCLLEGEGRFQDIIVACGYAMLPMVLLIVPATLLSHMVAENEEVIYFVIIYGAVIYFLILAVIGVMTVHNFSSGKTILIILLTFVAMFIILFLVLMLTSLLGQIISFFRSFYDEILLRI